jgi:hypothetical protein
VTRPIALATCAEVPVEADEAPLDEALAQAGVPFEWVVWDDPGVDWARFAGVLVRTTWDYTDKIDAFRAWAVEVDRVTALWNPAPVLVWNSHKRYLAELAARGVDVVPTVLVPAGAAVDVADLPAGPDGLVVKPAESVGAIGLTRWPAGASGAAGATGAVAALHDEGQDVLVQPLLRSIAEAGETSLIVVDGEVSHAVRKVPAPGDIRSQPEWGSDVTAVAPSVAEVALGRRALEVAADLVGIDPATIAYARVDSVTHGGVPVLMELELIEPDLYLAYDDRAAARVVAAVARRAAS